MISNEHYNRGVKNIELQDINKVKYNLRVDKDEYEIGDFVTLIGASNKYQIEKKIEKPLNFLDFYNHGIYKVEELKSKISDYFSKIKNKNYKMIIEELIFKSDDFFLFPAAKAIHHAYIGGLATHTLSMLKLAEGYVENYNLCEDLLYTAIILHDYGKIFELKDYGMNYSVEGNLLGHINICYEKISIIASLMDINDKTDIVILKHLILSHHGKLEYGSPKEPMTLESYVLSQIDEVDAKIDVITKVIKETPKNKLSAPVMAMERRRFINVRYENE